MDTSRLHEAVRVDGLRLGEVARDNLDARIEHCPEWDMAALVEHTAMVYRFMAACLKSSTPDAPPKLEAEDAPSGDAVVDYFGEKHTQLLEALAGADPDAAAWNWTSDPTARFFWHRMASETAIHRWDAENAVGEATIDGAFDADLAADGIDEVIAVGMQHTMRGPVSDYPPGSLHLHRTDGEGEWMLTSADGALVVTEEHGKGDAAVRGSASALFLYLWGRVRLSDDALQIFGDSDIAAAWAQVAP